MFSAFKDVRPHSAYDPLFSLILVTLHVFNHSTYWISVIHIIWRRTGQTPSKCLDEYSDIHTGWYLCSKFFVIYFLQKIPEKPIPKTEVILPNWDLNTIEFQKNPNYWETPHSWFFGTKFGPSAPIFSIIGIAYNFFFEKLTVSKHQKPPSYEYLSSTVEADLVVHSPFFPGAISVKKRQNIHILWIISKLSAQYSMNFKYFKKSSQNEWKTGSVFFFIESNLIVAELFV